MNTTNKNYQVAKTILDQLGGNKFIAMLGVKNLVAGNISLTFRIPSNFAKIDINSITVTLNNSDAYDIDFHKISRGKCKTIAFIYGIYADNLQNVITQVTGLDTHL